MLVEHCIRRSSRASGFFCYQSTGEARAIVTTHPSRRARSGFAAVALAMAVTSCERGSGESPTPWPYEGCYAATHHDVASAPFVRMTGATSDELRCPPALRGGSVNDTPAMGDVRGTDLGIFWEGAPGTLMVAFGDSYGGATWQGPGPGTARDAWRRNFLATSVDRDPSDGVTLSAFVTEAGHAIEMVGETPGIDREESVIPTAGIRIGSRDYLHFMSVRRWRDHVTCPRWQWVTNYSFLAYSDDDGRHWTRSALRFDGSSRFAVAALAEVGENIYVLGTPAGRIGDIYLARVARASLLDDAAYVFWSTTGWQAREEHADPFLKGPAGELSLLHHPGTGRWLLTYLSHDQNAIVMRSAAGVEGPWSEEVPVIDAGEKNPEHPRLYGGFMIPRFTDEASVYLAVSKIACYGVFTTRVEIPTALR